jgi:hypothetical protein
MHSTIPSGGGCGKPIYEYAHYCQCSASRRAARRKIKKKKRTTAKKRVPRTKIKDLKI